MQLDIIKGTAYEITDNTVIFIEVEQRLSNQQKSNLIEELDYLGRPIYVLDNGSKVKLVEDNE